MSTNNINLEQVLSETIVSSKKAVGEAVEWALKQTPEICDQYLKYEMISAIISVCLLMVVLTLIVTAYCKMWKWIGKMYNSDREEEDRVIRRGVTGFFMGLIVLFLLACLEKNVNAVVKIQVAPKVYLVEFATKLVK